MKRVLIFLRQHWPIFTFILLYVFIFQNFFFKKLIPFPGDLLTSWFFPYSSGGWEGYSPWITRKEFILADVVRQIYPWRILAMDLLKQGIMPLWNVYAFSGNPLLANLQSAVLYPLNIIFLLLEQKWAWITYIMLQPVLATFFMYLFIRSIKLSRLSAIFAGIGFSFIGYIMVWFEMGTIGHTALWLPFILWGITKFMDTKKTLYIVLAAFGVTCSILAGHAQTAAYVFIFSVSYLLYIGRTKLNIRQILGCLIVLFIGITLASIQIIPSLELMAYSARDTLNSTTTFHKFITPWSHIAMLFAPDFFGNPAAGNFWGKDYGEFMSYFGVVVLLVGVIGFYTSLKNRLVRLSLITSIVSFLIAFFPPAAELIFRSHIPILSVGLPSRMLFLVGVGFVIASAFGVEAIQKMRLKKIIPPIIVVSAIYILLWIILLRLNIDPVNLATSKRNLLMPTVIAFIVGFFIIARKYTKHFSILWIVMFLLMGLEYSYFMNKYLPYAPSQYMFPPHGLMNKLPGITGLDRVYGYDSSGLGTNLPVQFRILSPEGYDPLYIRNYSELMYAVKTGKFEINLPRSDALIPESQPKNIPINDSYNKQFILNLLGVRFGLDKDDLAGPNWDPWIHRFPADRFNLVYQEYKWKVFENKKSIPRASIFYDYAVISQKDKSIQTLLDPKFPYSQKLILNAPPSFAPKSLNITPAKINVYSANLVKINTNSLQSGLLFLSDNYYPGWKAFIDNKPAKIILADYSFRAVELSKGKHEVRFEYQPNSFFIGALISFVSLVLLGVSIKKKTV